MCWTALLTSGYIMRLRHLGYLLFVVQMTLGTSTCRHPTVYLACPAFRLWAPQPADSLTIWLVLLSAATTLSSSFLMSVEEIFMIFNINYSKIFIRRICQVNLHNFSKTKKNTSHHILKVLIQNITFA